MNELLKYAALNFNKVVGALIGFILALFIIFFGIPNTLLIIALVVLGFIFGKWRDEGFSFTKFFRDIAAAVRDRKWN
jgi:uncharacterized membrane protein